VVFVAGLWSGRSSNLGWTLTSENGIQQRMLHLMNPPFSECVSSSQTITFRLYTVLNIDRYPSSFAAQFVAVEQGWGHCQPPIGVCHRTAAVTSALS